MTRTAIYSLQDNTLTEQPTIEEPKDHPVDYPPESSLFAYYYEAWKRYDSHVSTLRTIPAHESCRSLWKDGQKVEENRDYDLRKWCKDPELCSISSCDCKEYAFPLAVKSEDITERTFSFDETLGYLIDFGNMVLRNRDRLKWDMSNDAAEWLADQLKKIHHH